MCDIAQIDRYLLDGLPAREEQSLRHHLSNCESCRSYYDEQVILLRALAGDPGRATGREEVRLSSLVLGQAGLSADPAPEEKISWRERILWAPPRWRRWALAGACCVLILSGALIFTLLSGPSGPGHLFGGHGLTIDGTAVQSSQLSAGELRIEGRLAVGPEGMAELVLDRGGSIRLFPDTEIALSRNGHQVDLLKGRIWCRVTPGQGEFRVTTSTARVEVLGTSFVVERRDPGDTEVRVVNGRVRVADPVGQGLVQLGAGQKTSAREGHSPSAPGKWNLAQEQQDWLVSFDRTNPQGHGWPAPKKSGLWQRMWQEETD